MKKLTVEDKQTIDAYLRLDAKHAALKASARKIETAMDAMDAKVMGVLAKSDKQRLDRRGKTLLLIHSISAKPSGCVHDLVAALGRAKRRDLLSVNWIVFNAYVRSMIGFDLGQFKDSKLPKAIRDAVKVERKVKISVRQSKGK